MQNSRYITWIKNHVLFQLGRQAGCKIKKSYNSWEEFTQCKKLIAINHNGILAPNNKNFYNIKTKSARFSKNAILGWQQFLPKIAVFSFQNKKITSFYNLGPQSSKITLHFYPKWENRHGREVKEYRNIYMLINNNNNGL